MKRVIWTAEEEEIVRRRYPDERTDEIADFLGRDISQVYRKAHALGLAKTAAYMASPNASRLRRGDEIGKAYRFPKGHVPANKGIKGVCHPGSVPTQFKKGSKPGNWKPIGSERLSKEGYLQRKLTDTGYPPRDWVLVHHIIWRDAGRDIPAGFRLTFKDGNKKNIVLSNLQLVSVADMMRRNTIHNYGPEIAELTLLRARIARQIKRRSTHV